MAKRKKGRYTKKGKRQTMMQGFGSELKTEGSIKNTAIETGKAVLVGVLGGGLLGAAIGKPSFIVGILTTAAAIKDYVEGSAPPSPNVTWAVKGQVVLRLFVPPPPIDPTRSLEDATERTHRATCLIEVTR